MWLIKATGDSEITLEEVVSVLVLQLMVKARGHYQILATILIAETRELENGMNLEAIIHCVREQTIHLQDDPNSPVVGNKA